MADPIGLLDKGPYYGTNGTVCNPRRAHGVSLSLSVSSCYRTSPKDSPAASLARWKRGNPTPNSMRRREAHMIDFPKRFPQEWQSVSPLRRCARMLSRRNQEKGLLPYVAILEPNRRSIYILHPPTPRPFPPSVGTPDFPIGQS